MTNYSVSSEVTRDAVVAALGDKVQSISIECNEVCVVVAPSHYHEAAQILYAAPDCAFEQLIDLCGVDYSEFKDGDYVGPRFCIVSHLLSVSLNQRLRLKVYAIDNDLPMVDSLNGIWNSANWFEREAFDLFGIVFSGHEDLRRILTDYGFIGHPFRKDFPVTGHVEMRFDAEQSRVVYQPVTIEAREITPRIIREDRYGSSNT